MAIACPWLDIICPIYGLEIQVYDYESYGQWEYAARNGLL